MAPGSSARQRIRTAAAGTAAWITVGERNLLEDVYRHGQGWVLNVSYTEHGEIKSASVGRWVPDGKPSEKLTAVLRVLAGVK